MDVHVTSKSNNKSQGAECHLRGIKPEENAQRVNFCQNDNAPLNQTSFIPIYTKKNMCHNFSKSATEDKTKSRRAETPEPVKIVNNLYSSPQKQKDLINQIPGRGWNSHIRRQSVGFEDMTSLSSNYGYNKSSFKRIQAESLNRNLSAESALRPNNQKNLENDKNVFYIIKKKTVKEDSYQLQIKIRRLQKM
ncbi:hypothetical protein CEXT_504431 [Caerostris extrusa]|uniref:Uncharacterized protein n=1 Tax=Caerostris extrusa TaxID=172846 RepID=A0AAV4TPI9_CAEEX|nr:hypothetical protein CEXT_504431 [Caerostris extrusa]